MKLTKFLSMVAAAVALFVAANTYAESCCVKAKVKGKDCDHKCCVSARKESKTCDKCQTDASCCDKAIAKGKDCSHPCCVAAAKDKKTCDKCNKKKDA